METKIEVEYYSVILDCPNVVSIVLYEGVVEANRSRNRVPPPLEVYPNPGNEGRQVLVHYPSNYDLRPFITKIREKENARLAQESI